MSGYSLSKDAEGGVYILPDPEGPTDLTTAFRLAKSMARWPMGDNSRELRDFLTRRREAGS